MKMYADDVNITIKGNSLEELLNLADNQLPNVAECMLKANKLS